MNIEKNHKQKVECLAQGHHIVVQLWIFCQSVGVKHNIFNLKHSPSSSRRCVHSNSLVPQLLVLDKFGYLFNQDSYCSVSAQVFWYLVEICEAWISMAVGPPDLALINDTTFYWYRIYKKKYWPGLINITLCKFER